MNDDKISFRQIYIKQEKFQPKTNDEIYLSDRENIKGIKFN